MFTRFFLKTTLFFLILIGSIDLKAQDIQFSMFYSVPLYLNPAFAGSRHANRGMLHHRWQWPNQAGRFYTGLASFDTYSSKYRSGIGAMLIHDYGNALTSTMFSLQYAYELRINSVHVVRFGIQGGFVQRNLSITDTPGEYSNDGRTNPATGGIRGSVIYPDISAGILWYARSLFVSFSMHHMNRPNESLLVGGYGALPIKTTLTAGYKIPLVLNGDQNGTRSSNPIMMAITPTMTFKTQSGSSKDFISGGTSGDQVDLGIYYTYKWLIAGVWYRGIPFKAFRSSEGKTYQNNESVVLLVGASYQGFGAGYAYDITVSSQGLPTGGSHEINLSYVFRTKHSPKNVKSLPCPDFEYDILRRGSAGKVQ